MKTQRKSITRPKSDINSRLHYNVGWVVHVCVTDMKRVMEVTNLLRAMWITLTL